DPAGRAGREAMRARGRVGPRGEHDIRRGIAAGPARLRTGRLRVRRDACPNLLNEARLYRYPSAAERALRGENPVDEHNHALGALRYLISRLDAHFIAKLRKQSRDREGADATPLSHGRGSDIDSEHLWTRLS